MSCVIPAFFRRLTDGLYLAPSGGLRLVSSSRSSGFTMALLIGAAIGLGALFLTHAAPFPFLLEAFKPRHSIWHMPRDRARPAIYLTFADGPNPAATPQLLDVLARERV